MLCVLWDQCLYKGNKFHLSTEKQPFALTFVIVLVNFEQINTMKNPFLFLAFILCFCHLQGQNWLTFSVPQFSEDVIKASNIEVVYIYEIPADRNNEDSESGHVVRVVKFPTMSYGFDRQGRIAEEIVYKENSEVISSKAVYVHGVQGVSQKDVYTYTYNDVNGEIDTILAQHRIHRYEYNPEGKLVTYLIAETDEENELPTDNVGFVYNGDGQIQNVDFQHIQRRMRSLTEYTHQSSTECIGVKKGGGKTEVKRDDEGRFVQVKDYLTESPNPNTDIQYMYKKGRLDSTYAEYIPAIKGKVEPNIVSSGYYYDRDGKLVMVRTYGKEGMLREQLFEYFTYRDKE